MKKPIEITLEIIIMISLLAGCGEHVEEDKAEKVQTSEIETDQEDGLMPGSGLENDEQKESNLYQEESCVEPTEEHDKQMLALLDEACGSQIYVYVSVDMDKDGEHEMIGVTHDDFSIWYCSSDLKYCYMVSEGPSHWYDDCTIEQIEFDEERHIVVDTYNMFGDSKSYSILALHDGEIEILVNDNYGYVYLYYKDGKYKEYGAGTVRRDREEQLGRDCS